MRLRHVQTVLAIAGSGLIRSAASKLGRSQSALTKQLRRMEVELGQPLFQRTSRGVVPTRPSVARQFDVAASAVIKWVQRYSETRSAGLSRMGGYCRPKLEGRRAWVLEQIKARPSITLAGLRDRFGDRGVAAIWRF